MLLSGWPSGKTMDQQLGNPHRRLRRRWVLRPTPQPNPPGYPPEQNANFSLQTAAHVNLAASNMALSTTLTNPNPNPSPSPNPSPNPNPDPDPDPADA